MAGDKDLNVKSWKGIADLCLWAYEQRCIIWCTIRYKRGVPMTGPLTVQVPPDRYIFEHPAFASQGKRFEIGATLAEGGSGTPAYRYEKDKVEFVGSYEVRKKE